MSNNFSHHQSPHTQAAPNSQPRKQEIPNLDPNHDQEWLNSQVAPEVIALNVKTLSDTAAYPYLLYGLPDSERRNDGRLRDYWLHTYQHLEQGGWWCSGIDVLTGEDSLWGCFKPNQPRLNAAQNKIIKYEHPPKVATELFTLKVPERLWIDIACRYELLHTLPDAWERRHPYAFWQWVRRHPQIPIIITEGAKKAAALLTAGYVSIATSGIWNWVDAEDKRQQEKIHPFQKAKKKVNPYLKWFCQPGREFIIAFDSESKPKTQQNVAAAIKSLSKALRQEGCSTSIAVWSPEWKGVDDYLAANGVSQLEQVIDNRLPFSWWFLLAETQLKSINLNLDQRYMPNLVVPEAARLVGIKGPKGTGKTLWLSQQLAPYLHQGRKILLLSHRRQLVKELSNRLGIDSSYEFNSSSTRGVFGYGLCLDSLHQLSHAHFNPDEWEDCIVVIDECEQVFWHGLTANTEIKKHRVEILTNMSTVIGNARRVYLSDADLSSLSIDYAKQMLGIPHSYEGELLYTIQNNFVHQQRQLYHHSSPEALLAALLRQLAAGARLLIHIDGQKSRTTYGTVNLERLIRSLFPALKVLRIDSTTIADPEHEAYGCIEHLNQLLTNYDVVLASPTIGTGVSIDLQGHFDAVFGFGLGAQTADAFRQALSRLREDVPRYIYCQKRGRGQIGAGSTNPRELLTSQKKQLRVHISLLQTAGFDELGERLTTDHLHFWARWAARHNLYVHNYRDTILRQLKEEGYQIREVPELESVDLKELKKQMQQIKTDSHLCECLAISEAPELNEVDFQRLKNQQAKTTGERHQERKTTLSRRYGVEVTPELVRLDDGGLYSQLRLQFWLTWGRNLVAERDKRVARQEANKYYGEVFAPDFNSSQEQMRVKVLELLNVQTLLDFDAIHSHLTLAQWYEEVLELLDKIPWARRNIKELLNINITNQESPMRLANRLLRRLGGKMVCIQQPRRGKGERVRLYQLQKLYLEQDLIFTSWLSQELQWQAEARQQEQVA